MIKGRVRKILSLKKYNSWLKLYIYAKRRNKVHSGKEDSDE
jgi:hypothetical protein